LRNERPDLLYRRHLQHGTRLCQSSGSGSAQHLSGVRRGRSGLLPGRHLSARRSLPNHDDRRGGSRRRRWSGRGGRSRRRGRRNGGHPLRGLRRSGSALLRNGGQPSHVLDRIRLHGSRSSSHLHRLRWHRPGLLPGGRWWPEHLRHGKPLLAGHGYVRGLRRNRPDVLWHRSRGRKDLQHHPGLPGWNPGLLVVA